MYLHTCCSLKPYNIKGKLTTNAVDSKGVDNRGARGASASPLFWRLSIYRPLSRAMTAFAKETVDQRLYMPFRHWASAYSVHRSGRGTTSARR